MRARVAIVSLLLPAPALGDLPIVIGPSDVDPLLTDSGLATRRDPDVVPYRRWAPDPGVGYNTQALGQPAAEAWLSGRVP